MLEARLVFLLLALAPVNALAEQAVLERAHTASRARFSLPGVGSTRARRDVRYRRSLELEITRQKESRQC